MSELTPRQWQIVETMAEGLNQASVAERLKISRETLRSQLYGHLGYPGLYERIGVHTDREVVVWWFRRGQYQRPQWDAT